MTQDSTPNAYFDGNIPECPLIEISGAPLERGRQYGEQAAERIKRGVDHYRRQLSENDLSAEDVADIAGHFAKNLTVEAQDLLEEIQGIAQGANIPFESAMLINARTEILKIARRRQQGLPDFIEPDGCTGVIVEPRATAEGKLIHAQDWDWKTECAETAVVVRVLRDDGPDILTFTEAGGLARAGLNTAGISITGNYLECERDYTQPGIPLAVIRRRALEQQHLAKAIKIVHATQKSASNNMMLAQAGGIALNFECVPNETFTVLAQDGMIVHANHFISQAALANITDKGIANMPDSLYRDMRVRSLLQDKVGSITVDDVKEALFDDYQTPWSVCRPPRRNSSSNQSATVAMIVIQPEDLVMEIAILPALNRKFQRFELTRRG